MPDTRNYITTITLPDGSLYYIRDQETYDLVQQLVGGSLAFVISTDAGTTPKGVVWGDDPAVTGTLEPSATTQGKIYLVPQTGASGKEIYAEYVTVDQTPSATGTHTYV